MRTIKSAGKTTVFIVAVLLAAGPLCFAEQSEANEPQDFFEMPIEQLMEINVTTASKKAEPLCKAPSVMTVVTREEIETYGDRNLHQLLQRQPSIYTRDVFPYTDNVAGFRGDMSTIAETHTLILLNGRPIRESAQGLNVNLYQTFPLSVLENVELIRGPGSVLYGTNAFTGVVNLKTRVPDHNELSVSGMGGSYGYYESDTSAFGRTGELGYVAAFRVAGQQGYPYQMTDAAGVYGEDNRQYKNYSAVTHLDYEGFTFDFFGSDYDAFALGVQPFWSNPHSTFRDKKFFFNGGYQFPLHDRVKLELNATYNLQENYLSSSDPWIIGTNTSDFLGEATLYTNPLDNLNFVLGYLQEVRTNYHPDDDKFQSIRQYRYEPKSFYGQSDYEFDKFLKLIAGLQWNKSSEGFSDTVTRYGIIITPAEKWGVKLLRGEAFRAPVTLETDLYDPRILVGNKNLEPETITTYDAQIFYQDQKTYAAATYFHSTIDKLIVYDASVTPMSYMNGGKQSFYGIELEGKYFFMPNWHALGSFTYQQNEADEGISPSVVPDNMFKLGTAYSWDWGTASLFYILFGKPSEPSFPSMLAANHEPKAVNLVNFNLDIDLSKNMGLAKGRSVLTFRIENLFDEKIYVPTFAYIGSPNSFPYGPGRTWFAGLKLTF